MSSDFSLLHGFQINYLKSKTKDIIAEDQQDNDRKAVEVNGFIVITELEIAPFIYSETSMARTLFGP